MIIASIVFVASTALVAECTQYWQFMLVQGVATGVRHVLSHLPCNCFLTVTHNDKLAAGFLVGPTVAIVRHWCEYRFGTHSVRRLVSGN